MESFEYNYPPEKSDFSYVEAVKQVELLESQNTAVKEAQVLLNVAKYGEQPLTGISLIDTLKNLGPCPCIMCFRDEFIS